MILQHHINIQICISEFECQEGDVKCADGMQCINKYIICNKHNDCHDESDEDEDMCKGILYIVVLKLKYSCYSIKTYTHVFN